MNLYLKIVKNLLDKNSDRDLSKKQHWMPSPKGQDIQCYSLAVEYLLLTIIYSTHRKLQANSQRSGEQVFLQYDDARSYVQAVHL